MSRGFNPEGLFPCLACLNTFSQVSLVIGVRTRGGWGKGALAPPLFWELIYAYTAKSHGAETIRDNLPIFCAIGNPAVRAS